MAVEPVCPYCRGMLTVLPGALRCCACQREFPVVAGIPDLRVAPDPWIGLVEDRAKGLAVDTAAAPGFPAALREYWAQTPTTAAADAERHIEQVLRAEERTREWLEAVVAPPARTGAAPEQWLDLGCGTANLACVAPAGVEVTGVDIAFRWLVIARRRLAEHGLTAPLIGGNAESLPFPDQAFHRVIALGTVEQCQNLPALLREVRRVLRPGGRVHLRTANRFSLLAEPHVGLWGVGWLPRTWANGYVRARRPGMSYRHHRLPSASELRRAMESAGFLEVSVEAAALLPTERSLLPAPLRSATPVYQRMRRLPLTAVLFRSIAPLLDATGVSA